MDGLRVVAGDDVPDAVDALRNIGGIVVPLIEEVLHGLGGRVAGAAMAKSDYTANIRYSAWCNSRSKTLVACQGNLQG